jgi:hypothetical protein
MKHCTSLLALPVLQLSLHCHVMHTLVHVLASVSWHHDRRELGSLRTQTETLKTQVTRTSLITTAAAPYRHAFEHSSGFLISLRSANLNTACWYLNLLTCCSSQLLTERRKQVCTFNIDYMNKQYSCLLFCNCLYLVFIAVCYITACCDWLVRRWWHCWRHLSAWFIYLIHVCVYTTAKTLLMPLLYMVVHVVHAFVCI